METTGGTTVEKFDCKVPGCGTRKPTRAPVNRAGSPEGHVPPLCAACFARLAPAEQKMYAEGALTDAGVVNAAQFRRAVPSAAGRGRR